MMNPQKKRGGRAQEARERRQTIALSLLILLGLGSVVALSYWIETHRPTVDPRLEEESLYVTGDVAKRMSLSFSGLVADWYWMRSLQYVGRKVIKYKEQGDFQLDDLAPLDLRLLAPLLDTTTTLDPQFMAAYEYGAAVLPAVNDEDAVRLLKKGIAANPSAWRLYHHLGYIYWRRGEFQAAAESYSTGARLAGAPRWMEAMGARMLVEGGSRSTAREIYTRMFEQSSDEQVRDMARKRLLQLNSLDQRDALRRLMSVYQTRVGRCPNSWRELEHIFSAVGVPVDASAAPLDPTGVPYILRTGACDLDLNPKSEIPAK
jgi:tetratricopeptide (TPR) repeat protein